MFLRFVTLLFGVLLPSNLLAGEDFVATEKLVEFHGTFEVFVEEERQLSLAEFLKLPKSKAKPTVSKNLGFHTGRIWASYNLVNGFQDETDLRITFGSSDTKWMKLYIVSPDEVVEYGSGLLGEENPEFRAPTFSLSLNPGESKKLVFQIQPSDQSVDFRHHIMVQSEWSQFLAKDTIFFGGFIGGFLTIFFYNIFLYLSLRDRVFLFYLMFGLSAGMLFISGIGYVEQFLGETPHFDLQDMDNTLRTLSIGTALLFAYNFLGTKQFNPSWGKIYFLLGIMVTGNFVVGLMGYHSASFTISDLINNMTGVGVVIDGIICYRRGNRSALFYLLGWGALIASVSIWTLGNYRIIEPVFVVRYLPYIGFILEMVLMSFALGDRIKNLQKQSIIADEKAAEAETMKQLVRILSHDVNTPISVIRGATEILKKAKRQEMMVKYLGKIEKATKNLESITQHVRKLIALRTHKAYVELEPVNFLQIVDDAKFMFSDRMAEKEIKLQVECETDHKEQVMVVAEEASLGNDVLNNLLSNAIKFSSRGSAITIEIKEKSGKVEISVIDHGMGIPKELLPHLFDEDVPTHRAGTENEGGTGFGMPIVKSYIDAYGGDIDVVTNDDPESEDHGTTFRITLDSAS